MFYLNVTQPVRDACVCKLFFYYVVWRHSFWKKNAHYYCVDLQLELLEENYHSWWHNWRYFFYRSYLYKRTCTQRLFVLACSNNLVDISQDFLNDPNTILMISKKKFLGLYTRISPSRFLVFTVFIIAVTS